MTEKKIHMPDNAAYIVDTLMASGYEAYIVGGCVRDSLLGKEPCDWDITTSATPEEVKALFRRTIDTGIQHGTVTVMMGKEAYEITTYRLDGIYEDHRRPSEVTFTRELKEDLMRRDFTINAMAYNDVCGLVDLYDGVYDLSSGVIRCVGDPHDRFEEDALRMLRAIRFSAQLGFDIDPATKAAIVDKRENLKDVSAERIQMELLKLLISDHPERLKVAYETGLTAVFLPEFDAMMDTPQNNPHHMYTVGEHTLHAITNVEPNPVLRLTMLLHDIGKPATRTTDNEGIDHFYNHNQVGADMAKAILKRLKFDNRTIEITGKLISLHDTRFADPLTTGRKHVRKVMSSTGEALFPYLLKVMDADVRAQSDYLQDHKLTILGQTWEAYAQIVAAGDCLTLKDLKINGNDLKALGITEGKRIGTILKMLLDLVLENPALNSYLTLEELAREINRQLD